MRQLDDEMEITSNKHSTVRTGVEQPIDCYPICRLIKLFNKLLSVQGECENVLKEQIEKILKDEMDVTSLHPSNKKL